MTSCSVCNMLKGNYIPTDNYNPEKHDEKRDEYVAAIRKHIMCRRAIRMADFVSWTRPERSSRS